MRLDLGIGFNRLRRGAGGGGGTAPVITGVPSISGTATVGNTLTASPASVSGTPTPTRTWQWARDGVDIGGATSITYALVAADYGVNITVRQIETNGSGSANATSLGTAIAHLDPATLSPTAWFRPAEAGRQMQNANAVAVASGVGDPVGLHFDKSLAYALGTERITNGSLATSASWTSSQANTTLNTGAIVMTATPNSTIVTNAATTYTNGKVYEVTLTVSGYSAGAFYVQLSNGASGPAVNSDNISANGTYTVYILSNGNTTLRFLSVGTTTLSIDNISAREVTGNHATQLTAASRPTLGQNVDGVEYLTDDGGDSLTWTAPAGTYTVAYVNSAGTVTILTAQSLSGATDMLLATETVEYIAVNRALTSDETTGITAYLEDVANPT